MVDLRLGIRHEPVASQYEKLLKEKTDQSRKLQQVERLAEDLRKQNS